MPGVREAMLGMMGKSNSLSGGRQGERLTDERDQRTTGRERESTQRLGRSEGDTTENNDNEKRVAPDMAKTGGGDTDADAHIHHLKEPFIPRVKAETGTSCFKKSLCVWLRVCL